MQVAACPGQPRPFKEHLSTHAHQKQTLGKVNLAVIYCQ